MVDVIQRLILEAETGDTENKLAKVRKEQDLLEREIKQLADTGNKTSIVYRGMVQQLKELTDEEAKLERQLRETNDAYGDRSKVLKATDRFDRTSQGVSLAGDVESNARTIGGALGAFGMSGAERAVGAAAEIPALIEAIPRLKEAAMGLPSALGQAAQALGSGGLVVVAVAAGAAAIAALWKRSIKDIENSLKALAAASGDFVDFAAGGGTNEEAASSIEDSKRRIEFAQKEIVRLQELYADQQFNFADRIGNDGEQALVDQIKSFEESVRNEQAKIDRFSEAIANNELPKATQEAQDNIQEVIRAERELQAVRSQTVQTTTSGARLEAQFGNPTMQPTARNGLGSGSNVMIGDGQPSAPTRSVSSSGASERDRIVDINKQLNDDLLRQEIDFNREVEREQRRNQDELLQINIDRERKEKDAVMRRDFAAAAQARQDANDRKSDLAQQARIEARERQIAFNDQRSDTMNNYRNQLRDLQNVEQQKLQIQNQALNQSLQNMQQWAQGFKQFTEGATQSRANGASGLGSGMNSLSAIFGG